MLAKGDVLRSLGKLMGKLLGRRWVDWFRILSLHFRLTVACLYPRLHALVSASTLIESTIVRSNVIHITTSTSEFAGLCCCHDRLYMLDLPALRIRLLPQAPYCDTHWMAKACLCYFETMIFHPSIFGRKASIVPSVLLKLSLSATKLEMKSAKQLEGLLHNF